MSEIDLDELRAELDEFSIDKKDQSARPPHEERIIAGFEDIERFFEQHGRIPTHGENNDIFERLYAVRLDQIRSSEECISVLDGLDRHGLLKELPEISHSQLDELNDDELLAELEGLKTGDTDITKLRYVRTRAEVKAAEEVAQRAPCPDFAKFKPLFVAIQEDLKNGMRQSRRFKEDAQIKHGEFFIL